MSALFIAIYEPLEGNYYHWALHLQAPDSLIFEVTGSHPSFSPQTSHETPPETSSRRDRLVESIHVGDINTVDIEQLKEKINIQHVDNETVEWNCQDYVLEALESLVEECIVDGDDEVYVDVVERAKRKYYGPM
ncbi:hypothetical protein D6C90_06866 [Aureobasidium pullulans]|uniref:Uncharacterized protein n=1 Tax=Aureobasidium pullulans TaxID=5580 RepID=A0A4S9UHB4_AURPU|nr:hypothetical protein D6C90_06866 [Aureobasidium pullulans]